jgi:hypothetical protein
MGYDGHTIGQGTDTTRPSALLDVPRGFPEHGAILLPTLPGQTGAVFPVSRMPQARYGPAYSRATGVHEDVLHTKCATTAAPGT